MKKTILIVAMLDSIHTVRWVTQFVGEDWDIHVFPSLRGESVHPEMAGVTVHHLLYSERLAAVHDRVPTGRRSQLSVWFDRFRTHFFDKRYPTHRARQLARVVSKLRPDIVHSMEMQAGGYLTLDAKGLCQNGFPPWLVTLWGSDIFLFGRLDDHKEKIRAVLSECDFMSCECNRDVALAQSLGLKGEVVSSGTSVTGGIGPSELAIADSAEVPAERKIIMLKGYQHWAGRALSGLRALERCVEMLSGYEIVVHSAVPDVALAAKLFETNTGIRVRVLSQRVAHSEVLSLHAQARVSIGLSISDGISVSMLEAMAMGAFPIQSCTACADEWIKHGVSGMIVPPEDPDIIEMALRTALSDDDLVNRAAEINRRTVENKLNYDNLRRQANEVYKKIIYRQE